ncbi:unnamed protein product [Ambrosiozyma monospora]|uniref:Unnamed protein product n=1 Tax=Ambrosiozyma monospora TaxID=43982 RepID=A0A9W7DKB0_AMBMO|nr:unnamed protein product [Ambrosiozyma monospora]
MAQFIKSGAPSHSDQQQQQQQKTKIASLFMIDFRKAFDRVRLDYLKRVLEFLQLPPQAVEFICRFGISPVLFLLAEEPLLKKSDKKLDGIIYQPLSQFESGMPDAYATTVRIQAYADDVATFNATAEDVVNTVLLVRRFGRFAGLEINFEKSFVFTTDEQVQPLKTALSQLMRSRTLKVDSIESNPVYLGIPLLETDWNSKLEELVTHFQKILFMGLNITQRCIGIRTYIYSKLFFQHDPIPKAKLTEFQEKMVDLTFKYLPYKMSKIRRGKLLYDVSSS